jgi:hypothetical protein
MPLDTRDTSELNKGQLSFLGSFVYTGVLKDAFGRPFSIEPAKRCRTEGLSLHDLQLIFAYLVIFSVQESVHAPTSQLAALTATQAMR